MTKRTLVEIENEIDNTKPLQAPQVVQLHKEIRELYDAHQRLGGGEHEDLFRVAGKLADAAETSEGWEPPEQETTIDLLELKKQGDLQ